MANETLGDKEVLGIMPSTEMPENAMPVPLPGRNGVRAFKTYHSGSTRSQQRLAQLKHDPILKQVKVYWKIEAEIKRMEEIRDCVKIHLLPDGSVRKFSYTYYLGLLEQLQKINEVLMRYGYGRVPELENNHAGDLPPIEIHLTTKDGIQYDPNTIEVNVNDPASGSK